MIIYDVQLLINRELTTSELEQVVGGMIAHARGQIRNVMQQPAALRKRHLQEGQLGEQQNKKQRRTVEEDIVSVVSERIRQWQHLQQGQQGQQTQRLHPLIGTGRATHPQLRQTTPCFAAGLYYAVFFKSQSPHYPLSALHRRLGSATTYKAGYEDAMAKQRSIVTGFVEIAPGDDKIDTKGGVRDHHLHYRLGLLQQLAHSTGEIRYFANLNEAELYHDITMTVAKECQQAHDAFLQKEGKAMSVRDMERKKKEVREREISAYISQSSKVTKVSKQRLRERWNYLQILDATKKGGYVALCGNKDSILENAWRKKTNKSQQSCVYGWNDVYGPPMNFVQDFPLRSDEAAQITYHTEFHVTGQRIWPYLQEDFKVFSTNWVCASVAEAYWQATNTHPSQIQNMQHVNPFHPLSFDRFGFAADAESNARFSWFPETPIDGRPTKIRAVSDVKAGSYLGIIPGKLHYGYPPQLGWLQGPNGVYLQPCPSPLVNLIIGPRRHFKNVQINYETTLDACLQGGPSYRFVAQAHSDISAGDVLSIGIL
ncbi:hypothetical protein N0V83_008027 [Neocucurbitaria cava]|uniref:Uncharacterized protein n=1 Tax=Neocucurbitaria cava TaxID=798079 RepID=A0A9W9CK19_9PLEO|nr:hypothetical protein N0V83_008027 [Neocucurbitaria cava]